MNKRRRGKGFPYVSAWILAILVAGCLMAGWVVGEKAGYMNLSELGLSPGRGHIFGTDPMGRDLFSMVFVGGKNSLFIGVFATGISTAIAVIYGCFAGISSKMVDNVMMRFTDVLMSIPQILLVIFLQAALGQPNAISISLVIGITGWMAVAKVMRSEVRQLRKADHVLAARMMGGGFFYVLRRHLFPACVSAMMFMVVANLGAAIALEATLSFLGLGLPVEAISWGSLMALSQKALLSGLWWLLIIPGAFLVMTLICITNIGEYVRLSNHREKLI